MAKKTGPPPLLRTAKKALERKTKEKFDHAKHWKGMPEFNQPDAGPVKSLIVNFASMEDVHRFAKLIGGQIITAKTRSVWYPFVPEESALDKRWSDKKK